MLTACELSKPRKNRASFASGFSVTRRPVGRRAILTEALASLFDELSSLKFNGCLRNCQNRACDPQVSTNSESGFSPFYYVVALATPYWV